MTSVSAFLGFAFASLVFHWPLPQRLASAFTGPVNGDMGVYVWNLWVFRHEIVAHRRLPLFTNEILSLTQPVDLSLHNYTLFADLLAFPLIPYLGVTATFNVIYLALTTLTAWAMFVLARAIVGRATEAWLAGLLFGFSPILVARSTAHFSLVAAAPLPIFVLCLMRAERDWNPKSAIVLGATIAWATMCDAYFGVYCLMIGACYLLARQGSVSLHREGSTPAPRMLLQAIDFLVVVVAALVGLIVVTGGTELHLAGQVIGFRTLYTPVLTLTILVAIRLWLSLRPAISFEPLPPLIPVMRWLAVAAGTCLVLLSPVLYALRFRLADGGSFHQPIFWRSSPRGMDLLALFTPNPSHKLFGMPWRAWLTDQPGGYAENVASLTIVGVVVTALAIWRYRFRPPRVWLLITVIFGWLALGPFVHVGGVNTFIPGPWALLRYVPLVSAVRMPTRFAIILMMAFAVVFALALAWVADRCPGRRRLWLGAVGLLLVFELAPLPRRAPEAPIPDIYQIIAEDPRDVSVLEIPFGVSDGEASEGSHNAASQFYQTFHQKRLLGGTMSRITENVRRRHRRFPVLRGLLSLSEGRPIGAREVAAARRGAPRFIRSARVGYVVIDTLSASPELRQFAVDVLRLIKVAESEGRELYRPAIELRSPRPRSRPRFDPLEAEVT